MRYLILSDIHGNLEALRAVLAVARDGCDQVVCCGDLVGYGPDPNAVVEWARENVAVVVRGNHDKACCGISGAEEFNLVARSAAFWTRQQLTVENLEYLRALPSGPIRVGDFHLVHGSIRDEDEYLFVPQDAGLDFPLLNYQLAFFGHTHLQGGFVRLPGGSVEPIEPSFPRGVAAYTLELREREQYLVNPGSVGQPRDGDARAAFAVYLKDEGRDAVEYWRVPYEVESTQRKMLDAGLPQLLARRLSFGR